jgi:hypothetical protein
MAQEKVRIPLRIKANVGSINHRMRRLKRRKKKRSRPKVGNRKKSRRMKRMKMNTLMIGKESGDKVKRLEVTQKKMMERINVMMTMTMMMEVL